MNGPSRASPPADFCSAVLIVDDNRDLRALIGDILARDGYRVLYAEDGAAALEALREARGAYLVLADLNMPRLDGWELISLLGAASRHKVVVMSAYLYRAPLPVAVAGVLSKPFTLDELKAAVRAFCGDPPAARAGAEAGA
jgi:CheY-like chemotaxis protein